MGTNGDLLMNNVLNIISSSSAGNCYIYNEDLMIDIGVSYIKAKPYLKDIKLLLLTHSHSDHFNSKTIKKALYEYPNIKIICGKWLREKLIDIGVNKGNIYVLELDKTYDLGKYIITPVMAVHDVPNCGYKITIKSNGYKIFHITDTGSLSHIEAKDYDWYSVEGNYESRDEIDRKIIESKNKGEFTYLERAKKNHMEQVATLNWLDKNKGEHSHYRFIHEHQGGESDE